MNKSLLALFLATLGTAVAQTTPDTIHIGDVAVTGSLRSRVYAWYWFQPAAGYQNDYGYSGNILRLNLAEKRDALDLGVEAASASRRSLSPSRLMRVTTLARRNRNRSRWDASSSTTPPN